MSEDRKKQLIIWGASGHGRVVADCALTSFEWQRVSFVDDVWPQNKYSGKFEILGRGEDVDSYRTSSFIVGIGDNEIRKSKQAELLSKGLTLVNVVHVGATLSPDLQFGRGNVIMAGAIINNGADIGNGCIINTGAIIEHDASLSDFVHISPNASLGGNVQIGENSWIGIGAVIKNNITVSKNVIVGAGAVVTSDILESGTYVGVPAKKVNTES